MFEFWIFFKYGRKKQYIQMQKVIQCIIIDQNSACVPVPRWPVSHVAAVTHKEARTAIIQINLLFGPIFKTKIRIEFLSNVTSPGTETLDETAAGLHHKQERKAGTL